MSQCENVCALHSVQLCHTARFVYPTPRSPGQDPKPPHLSISQFAVHHCGCVVSAMLHGPDYESPLKTVMSPSGPESHLNVSPWANSELLLIAGKGDYSAANHWPTDGHLGQSQLGALPNKAAVSARVKHKAWYECKLSFLWGECPGVRFLGDWDFAVWFYETPESFPRAASPAGACFTTSAFWYRWSFYFGHSNGCVRHLTVALTSPFRNKRHGASLRAPVCRLWATSLPISSYCSNRIACFLPFF